MSTSTVRGRPGERGYPTCAHCGRVRQNSPRGRFCSDQCRQRAYRRRRAHRPEALHPVDFGAMHHNDTDPRPRGSPLRRRQTALRNAGDLPRYATAAGERP